jgi:ACR3 family arsenite efflux pump ArsB
MIGWQEISKSSLLQLLLEWVLINQMSALLFIMIFQNLSKIIIKKLDEQEETIKPLIVFFIINLVIEVIF